MNQLKNNGIETSDHMIAPSSTHPSTIEHHQPDLKEAIYYLPSTFDESRICSALKTVYPEQGRELALEWYLKTKNSPPGLFDEFWDGLGLTSYQLHTLDDYLKETIYDLAKRAGWIPKALRKGKHKKRSPLKGIMKEVAEELNARHALKTNLEMSRERHIPDQLKSFIPASIVNKSGACYFHPHMKREDIPENEHDYLKGLTKIVDCEVRVLEAIEYVTEQQGRMADDKEVRYKLELNDKRGKQVVTEVTHEELTTKTRFSSFLVSKGFIKFIGENHHFDMFHAFLINEQDYPTLRNLTSWGEYRPGEFLFENGLFSVNDGRFHPADEKLRIQTKNKLLICPSGSEQVMPPVLSTVKGDTRELLTDKFLLWEQFNGALNVRTTLGYAVACVFSREIVDKLDGFPILFKFGERGTGKSTSMDWLMALFGYQNGNRQSVSKQNTVKSVIRRMTLPRSFPFFLDDYRNHETNSQAPDMTSNILNWYHRIGTAMAKKSTDHQTIETPMKACVVMTGNDKPTDPAVLSRLVILNFNKFLKKGELQRVSEVSDVTPRFSEFLALILENYEIIREHFFIHLKDNQTELSNQGFEGRTVNNWAIILAGLQSIITIFPGLHAWFDNFEAFRSDIYNAIRKEQSLHTEHNPIHEFFQAIEHYATQRFDPGSEPPGKYLTLDHRHFRIKEFEEVRDHTGKVIYRGPVLAVHLKRVWSSLQDIRASITSEMSLTVLESHLQNSSYFLDKSVQMLLTKSMGAKKEGNVRCYILNVNELISKGMMEELIDKARDYEKNRVQRLSF
ncbi:MAG: hypothetical protein GVY07_03085 [Bacteroidetes bacterium]|jgi:hypothetical protein|nr:hypothetical protein [Bacteroidota bacterium]